MKLTDRQKASGLTLTDIVHVVLINDTTQDPNGSSYKADMQQIIDLVPKYWTSGSTGTFAIKAVNDSGIDATGDYAVASGYNTLASELYSFAEGHNTTAMGQASHAEGQNTTASGEASHVEGYLTVATDFGAHAEGVSTAANGYSSHAEGYNTTANGSYSHAEGQDTLTVGDNSHAEGYLTQANGSHSHAEGTLTIANGHASHAEGLESQANGEYSHAGGQNSTASGQTSFVHGDGSYANGTNTIVFGANIVGTDADKTYVDAFNIKTVGATTSIYNLGYDSAGNVVVGNDKFISGLTFNNGTYVLTANRNDGVDFSQDLSILASDIKVTGGTYNPDNGSATFTNNTGGTFNVNGFMTDYTDVHVTGGTYTTGTTVFTNSSGNTFTVTGYTDSPFEKIDEGNNPGIIVRDRDPLKYGPIGEDAFDISWSSNASSNAGATGTNSFAQGYDVVASGSASCAFGDTTTAGGTLSFVTGKGGSEAGYCNFLTGGFNIITDGAYATVVGQFANSITNNISNVNDGGNTMFAVGNGTATGGGDPQTRSTAFQIFQSGLIIAPTLSTSIISTEATGKVLITKEYLTGYTNTNLQKIISASYTATSADNNYTILINNGGSAINITIPSGLLDKINVGFIQQGSADVTFVAGGGVTINSPSSMLKIKGQNYNAYFEQVGSTDVYQLLGNLKA